MQKMRFDTQQPKITIHDLGDGKQDVVLLTNEVTVTEITLDSENPENSTKKKVYEYDGNIFRTVKELTEDEILANTDIYLNYEGDAAPTQEMIDYANEKVDEYTMQLLEGGLL